MTADAPKMRIRQSVITFGQILDPFGLLWFENTSLVKFLNIFLTVVLLLKSFHETSI